MASKLRKQGGTNYSSIGDSYMLIDKSLKKGGRKTNNDKMRDNRNVLNGGDNLNSFLNPQILAFDTLSKNILSKTSLDTLKTSGGKSNKNNKIEGGTALIELAPFISSLVLLGLRAVNDKALQNKITKKIGTLVSTKSKSKKSLD